VTRNQLIDAIRARGERLRELRVASLHIFGSMARDEAGPESDVDVLVDFEGPPSFDRYMDLKFFLEDLIGRPVDLVTRAAVRPRMRLAIEREAIRVS
jgi:predicted nucleotidyltransferase